MLHPIILAGSPLSLADREDTIPPLHFEAAPGVQSRYQQLLSVLSGAGFAAPLVVMPQHYAGVAASQATWLSEMQLILEPRAHKPAAALLSALLALKDRPEALVVVSPATTDASDLLQFSSALQEAAPAAAGGEIVMLGKRKERAPLGYGTLELATIPRDAAPVAVTRVLPSGGQSMLESLFQDNHQLVGAGIYVARVDVLLAAYEHHASEMCLQVMDAWQRAHRAGGTIVLDALAYRRAEAQSFEAAVAQRLDNLVAIQLDPAWSAANEWEADAAAERRAEQIDLAAWEADLAQDRASALAIASDMVAVYESHATAEADETLTVQSSEHDWGQQEILAMGAGFTLQRLMIHPGASVEVRATGGTAAHWVVAQGAALITMGAYVRLVWENQSLRIPAGRSRRIENTGGETLQLIQLQVLPQIGTQGARDAHEGIFPAGVA